MIHVTANWISVGSFPCTTDQCQALRTIFAENQTREVSLEETTSICESSDAVVSESDAEDEDVPVKRDIVLIVVSDDEDDESTTKPIASIPTNNLTAPPHQQISIQKVVFTAGNKTFNYPLTRWRITVQ